MSDATLSHDPAPGSGEDLPPHRAAIPVPPAILLEDKLTRRRKTVSIAVVFSVALHAGFLSAAALWGQGQPLPDADIFTAAIRVQIAEMHTGETIIAKGSEAAAARPAPIVIQTKPLMEAAAPATPQDAATARPDASPREATGAEPPAPAPAATAEAAPTLPAISEPPREIIAADSPPAPPATPQPISPAQSIAIEDIATPDIAASEQAAPPRGAARLAPAKPSPALAAAEQPSARHDAPAAKELEPAPDPAADTASKSPAPANMAAAKPDPDGEPGEQQGEAAASHLAAAMALVQETPQPDIEAAPPHTEAAASTARRPEERLAALLDLGSSADDAASGTGATKQDRAIPPEDGYKPPQTRGNKRANVNAAGTYHDGSAKPQAKSATRRVSLFGYKRRIRARVMRALPVGIWGPGRVVVGFRLSRSGGLLAATVLRSSGNAFMDEAALACVRNAGPYPRPPAGSAPNQLALSIDFRFQ